MSIMTDLTSEDRKAIDRLGSDIAALSRECGDCGRMVGEKHHATCPTNLSLSSSAGTPNGRTDAPSFDSLRPDACGQPITYIGNENHNVRVHQPATKTCKICGKPTTGSIGAAGIRWSFLCQPCKDREDNGMAKTLGVLAQATKALGDMSADYDTKRDGAVREIVAMIEADALRDHQKARILAALLGDDFRACVKGVAAENVSDDGRERILFDIDNAEVKVWGEGDRLSENPPKSQRLSW